MAERVVFLRAMPELSLPAHHPRNPHPSMNIGYCASIAESLGLEADIVDAVALLAGADPR